MQAHVRTLGRQAAGLVAVAALVAGSAATAAGLTGRADHGVVPSASGDRIEGVSPTGFAWRDGIRPGQSVVELRDSADPDGWRLVTEEGGRRITSAAEEHDAALRDSLPIAIAAMIMGGLAVVLLRGHRRWVAAAGCVGLSAAATSLELLGEAQSSTVAMGASALAPSIWLAWRPRFPAAASLALSAAAALLIGAWAVARLAALPAYDPLELVRNATAFWGSAVVVVASVAMPVLRDGSASIGRPRIGDVLLVAGAAGAALGLVWFLTPTGAGVILLAAILLVPAWRRWIADRAERTLLADLRDHTRLEATEAERAHLARELHDVPLQELAGVIRRLELIPEARAESDRLRVVAEQLRGVATELRPPVLDDLGLAPALEFLAEAASTDGAADGTGAAGVTVVAEVDDRTSLEPGGRPPAEVELAVFRVAQEAVANAIRHARPTEIRITGLVAADRVTLAVTDDGRGLDDAEARAASRRGRLGLASIRRRAEAIDAEVVISGGENGTRVALRWAR